MKKLDAFIIEQRKTKTVFRKTDFVFPAGVDNLVAGYYTVGKEMEVFCFIGYPKTQKPQGGYPAIVLVHGGEGYAFFEWVKYWTEQGYVAISPDFDGHYATDEANRLLENLKGGPHGYGSIKDAEQEKPWLFCCVASVLSSVDVLMQNACVNPDKIVAQGISWGGFVALTATAKEKRLRALSVVYSSAFISDSDWGMNQGLKDLSLQQLAHYNENIDPQTYLQEIECPVFFTAGMDDGAFTVKNRTRTAEKIRSQKLFSYRKTYTHGHIEGWSEKESAVFFEDVLNRKGLPLLALSDGEIIVENIKLDELYFVYTQEDPMKKDICEWFETSDFGDVLQNATAYFLYGRMENGLQFSSNVYFKKFE